MFIMIKLIIVLIKLIVNFKIYFLGFLWSYFNIIFVWESVNGINIFIVYNGIKCFVCFWKVIIKIIEVILSIIILFE